MQIRQTQQAIDNGYVVFSGLFIEGLEAGEAIAEKDVCYIKASDSKSYKITSSMTTELNQLIIMSLQPLSAGNTGLFLIRGIVESVSWSLTPGNLVIVPSLAGTIGEEAE